MRIGLLKGGWKKATRTAVWTASLVAFWGSFRLSEILPGNARIFDKYSDLLWEDLSLRKNSLRVSLKSPKVSTGWTSKVDLFALPRKLFCPVHWIGKLEAVLSKRGLLGKELPVFRVENGETLSRGKFLKIIRRALSLAGGNSRGLTGKSFRSGIPSELDLFPEDFKERHLKALGRWKSSAYQVYIRKELPEKENTLKIIAETLLENFSSQESRHLPRKGRP